MFERRASDRTDMQRLVVLDHGVSAIEILHAHLSIVDFVHDASFVERVDGRDVGLEIYAAVDLGALNAVLNEGDALVWEKTGTNDVGVTYCSGDANCQGD
jgi:hypothetical protein